MLDWFTWTVLNETHQRWIATSQVQQREKDKTFSCIGHWKSVRWVQFISGNFKFTWCFCFNISFTFWYYIIRNGCKLVNWLNSTPTLIFIRSIRQYLFKLNEVCCHKYLIIGIIYGNKTNIKEWTISHWWLVSSLSKLLIVSSLSKLLILLNLNLVFARWDLAYDC